jgi:hypothetical protein
MNSIYWNKIYESKNEDEVSWFQSEPKKSLELSMSCSWHWRQGLLILEEEIRN